MIFAKRFLFSLFLFSSIICSAMDAAQQPLLHAVCYDADNALIELRSLDDATMQLWREGKSVSAPFSGRRNLFLGESLACLDNGNIAVSTQGVRVFGQTGEQFEQIENFSAADTVCSHNGALYGVTREGDVSTRRSAQRVEHTERPIFSRGNPQVYGHSCWQDKLPFVVDSALGGSDVFLVDVETRQKQLISSFNPPNKIYTAYITQRGLLFLAAKNNECATVYDVRDKKIIATVGAVGGSTEDCRLALYPPKNMNVYWALMRHDFAKRTVQLWDLRCMRETVCQRGVPGTLTRKGDLSSDGSQLSYVGCPWEDPCTIDFGSSYFANEHDSTTVLGALGKRELGNRK
jgi:hypothetical protein